VTLIGRSVSRRANFRASTVSGSRRLIGPVQIGLLIE
jgi:hypothetical protein